MPVNVRWFHQQLSTPVSFVVDEPSPTYGCIFRYIEGNLGWELPAVVLEFDEHVLGSRRTVDLHDETPVKADNVTFAHIEGLLSEYLIDQKIADTAKTLKKELQQVVFPSTTFVPSVNNWILRKQKEGKFFNPDIIKVLYSRVIFPWFLPSKFKAKPHGVLFYGPPGTGKTEISSLFEEFFHSTNPSGDQSASRFFRPLVGETEKLMRDEVAVCLTNQDQNFVMIVDEFDSLGVDRNAKNEQSYKADFLNQMLALVGSSKYRNLLLVACTNFKEKLDPAILRDGRLDLHIYVPPLSPEERREFLKRRLAIHSEETNKEGIYIPPEDLEPFIRMTVNFTAGQFARLLREISDYKEFHGESDWTPDLLLTASKEYLNAQERPNLAFNEFQIANDQHLFESVALKITLFNTYKSNLSAYIRSAQASKFSLNGQVSGRFILGLTTDPFLEPELCQCIVPGFFPKKSISFKLAVAKDDVIGMNETNVFHMLQPVISNYQIQYVQLINQKTVPKDSFTQFFRSKITECEKSPVPSLIVVFVDQIIESTPQISSKVQNTVSATFGSAQAWKQQNTRGQTQSKSIERGQGDVRTQSSTYAQSIEGSVKSHQTAIKSQLDRWAKGEVFAQSQDDFMSRGYSSELSWNHDTRKSFSKSAANQFGGSVERSKANQQTTKDNSRDKQVSADLDTSLVTRTHKGTSDTADQSRGATTKFSTDKSMSVGSQDQSSYGSGTVKEEIQSVERQKVLNFEKLRSAVDSSVFSTNTALTSQNSQSTTDEFMSQFKNEIMRTSEPQKNEVLNTLSTILKEYANFGYEHKPFIALVVETSVTYRWMHSAVLWGQLACPIPTRACLYPNMMNPRFLNECLSKCASSLVALEMQEPTANRESLTPAGFLTWLANMDGESSWVFPRLVELKLKGSLQFNETNTRIKNWNRETQVKLVHRLKEAFPVLERFTCEPFQDCFLWEDTFTNV